MAGESDAIRMSELEGPYPPEKWPGWISGMSWAYSLWQYPPTKSAVCKCRYCDHAMRFPTYPESMDQVNGVLWMLAHTFHHLALGDIAPIDVPRDFPHWPG